MNVKQRALAGERVCGTMLRLVDSPAVLLVAKDSGLDFVMFDLEHAPYSFREIHDLCLLGRSIGLEVWARVPVATEDYISRLLDMGASGIMAPLVETPEYAADLVRFSKYAPVGERGFNNGGGNTLYRNLPHVEMMKEANERVMSIVQIESGKAVENIDAILSVPGVDAAIVGPNDLSVSLGIPGEHLHPMEADCIHKVADACRRHNKLFSIHCAQPTFKHYEKDVSFVMVGTDADILREGFKNIVSFTDGLDMRTLG